MKLSETAIEYLVGIITGDTNRTPYRSGPKLVDFFNELGFEDLYGSGFPARHSYVRQNILEVNGTERMKKVVEAAFNWSVEDEKAAEDNAFQFSRIISNGGYKLKKEYGRGFMSGDDYIPGLLMFEVVENKILKIETPDFFLSHESLAVHVRRCHERIESADYSGAITLAYTIVEEFIKLSLRARNVKFSETEGDIKKLYRLLAGESGLRVTDETSEALKPLLSGLSSMVTGFYEVANKASDRHAAKYRADRHHAKLVISLAMAFCDFLIDSEQHQKALVKG
ncbi:abortive infection family protein [Maritalea mobilis]|uniref:abortive infection family protein n=1 Tax=Maritalea mobilis TaxID=483324 RepID=UPI001C947288|nr:abortive infection family protein [Maritalea mobilis]MBY6202327.1 abortive infection family protein [Maritalea mobilis]